MEEVQRGNLERGMGNPIQDQKCGRGVNLGDALHSVRWYAEVVVTLSTQCEMEPVIDVNCIRLLLNALHVCMSVSCLGCLDMRSND